MANSEPQLLSRYRELIRGVLDAAKSTDVAHANSESEYQKQLSQIETACKSAEEEINATKGQLSEAAKAERARQEAPLMKVQVLEEAALGTLKSEWERAIKLRRSWKNPEMPQSLPPDNGRIVAPALEAQSNAIGAALKELHQMIDKAERWPGVSAPGLFGALLLVLIAALIGIGGWISNWRSHAEITATFPASGPVHNTTACEADLVDRVRGMLPASENHESWMAARHALESIYNSNPGCRQDLQMRVLNDTIAYHLDGRTTESNRKSRDATFQGSKKGEIAAIDSVTLTLQAQNPDITRLPTVLGSGFTTTIPSALRYIRETIDATKANSTTSGAQVSQWIGNLEGLSKPPRQHSVTARHLNDEGIAALQRQQVSQAIDTFIRAYQADPTDVEISNNLAYAYLTNEQLNEAEHYSLMSILMVPTRVNAWVNLAQVYALRNDLHTASACFAITYRLSKTPDKTRQFLDRLRNENPNENVRVAVNEALTLSVFQ